MLWAGLDPRAPLKPFQYYIRLQCETKQLRQGKTTVSEGYIGEFEHMVLLAIMQLGDSAYGVAIMDELEKRAGRTTSRGATYMTLDRMESKGLIRSRMGEPTAERGGRAKRLFRVTPAGTEAVRRSRAALRALSEGLEGVLEPGS